MADQLISAYGDDEQARRPDAVTTHRCGSCAREIFFDPEHGLWRDKGGYIPEFCADDQRRHAPPEIMPDLSSPTEVEQWLSSP